MTSLLLVGAYGPISTQYGSQKWVSVSTCLHSVSKSSRSDIVLANDRLTLGVHDECRSASKCNRRFEFVISGCGSGYVVHKQPHELSHSGTEAL